MVLERLLSQSGQLQAVPGLDLLPDHPLTGLLRQYIISCKVENKSPKTRNVYAQFVGYFIQFLAKNGINAGAKAIDRNYIRLYISWLQDRKLTPETVNGYYRALHTFFNWLETEKYISEDQNPFFRMHAPKVPKKHVRALPQEIMDNILELCMADTTFTGRRNLAIVLIFFDTGLRQEELSMMTLTDILFDQGLIRVMGKGSKERIVKMGETTQKALLRYLLMRQDTHEAVWVTEERQPMKQWGVASAIRRIAERVGIPKPHKRGTHVYRHTAATLYLRNHGNVKCLQELLGHENIKTTMKYVDALGPEAMIADHLLASPVDCLMKSHTMKSGLR